LWRGALLALSTIPIAPIGCGEHTSEIIGGEALTLVKGRARQQCGKRRWTEESAGLLRLRPTLGRKG
jgi:hypothetical protein